MRAVVNEHLDAGGIVEVTLEYGDKAYVDASLRQDFIGEAQVKILSPFDNVLIHRERLSALFGFDFRIECYACSQTAVWLFLLAHFVWRLHGGAHRL